MKDKQTKRKEALVRLQKRIAMAVKRGDHIRIQIKEYRPPASTPKPKTVAEAILSSVAADVPRVLRSSLEMNEQHIQRMRREEEALMKTILGRP